MTIKPIDGTHTIGAIGPQFGVVEIQRGWFYDWSREDRGIHYAYDVENGRAYYFAHSH
ncbi:MAG: hypothetical protein JNG90_12295 [Planctomycetaceae bacterium]|nr:hypothetical protein [Planctomycetaceae bacterium]